MAPTARSTGTAVLGSTSPSVFATILDADRGGLFRISPDWYGWSSKQLYLPDTNILITRFLMPDGVGEVQDFMPPQLEQRAEVLSIPVLVGDA